MKMKKKGSTNIWAFWPATIGVIIFLIMGVTRQDAVKKFLDTLLYAMGNEFGWFIELLTGVCFVLIIYICISKYGDIRIGGVDAKPEFSWFSYISMTICGGIGTGLLFWSIGEPMYHCFQPPIAAGVEAGTRESAIFAVSQTFMHWGFVEFAIYTICGIGFVIAVNNSKRKLSFGTILEPVCGKKFKWLETLIHAYLIFSMVGAIGNSMGAGILQIAAGLEVALGIAQGNLVYLLVAAFIALVFILMCISGLRKGMKYASTFCITVFIFLMLYTLLNSDLAFTGKLATESLGEYIDNFFSKLLINNTLAPQDNWAQSWPIQDYAGYMVYALVFGMFYARTSKGRTIREFILVNVVVTTLFAFLWISIFIGMGFDLQYSGAYDIWSSIQEGGMQMTIYGIIGNLPFGTIIQILFIVAIVVSFSTMADPLAAALATMSVHGLTVNDEAPKKFKIVIGVMIAGMAYVLVSTNGIDAIKGMYTLVGMPAAILLIVCIISGFKFMKQAMKDKNYMLPDGDAAEMAEETPK